MSRPMVVTVCMFGSSELWVSLQNPLLWHSRDGWRSRPQHQKRMQTGDESQCRSASQLVIYRKAGGSPFGLFRRWSKLTAGAVKVAWHSYVFALLPCDAFCLSRTDRALLIDA